MGKKRLFVIHPRRRNWRPRHPLEVSLHAGPGVAAALATGPLHPYATYMEHQAGFDFQEYTKRPEVEDTAIRILPGLHFATEDTLATNEDIVQSPRHSHSSVKFFKIAAP